VLSSAKSLGVNASTASNIDEATSYWLGVSIASSVAEEVSRVKGIEAAVAS
jgi:hypothetical protein